MQLVDLRTFKTQKCDQKHSPCHSPNFFNCLNTHSKLDRRRNPFSQNNLQIVYSQIYVQDFYSSDMCSNFIEYLYHPKIYKTLPCKSRRNRNYEEGLDYPGSCPHLYCPYLHENQDVSALLPYRNLPIKVTPVSEEITGVKELLDIIKRPKDNIIKYQKEIDEFKQSLRKMKAVFNEEIKESKFMKQIKYMPKYDDKNPSSPLKDSLDKGGKGQANNEKWYTAYTYFQYGQKLPIIEDRHHQFKNFRDIVNNSITPIVMKYIAAFLNSQGGVLYIGVDDNSIVNGFQITQHQFDKFLLSIDKQGKFNLYPPLMPQKYAVKRIPVYHHRKTKDLWVIQIKITPHQKQKKTLTTYNRECFMRMNASTHKLDAMDLMEYLRINHEEKLNDKEALKQIVRNLESQDRKSNEELCELKELANQLSSKIDSLITQNPK